MFVSYSSNDDEEIEDIETHECFDIETHEIGEIETHELRRRKKLQKKFEFVIDAFNTLPRKKMLP